MSKPDRNSPPSRDQHDDWPRVASKHGLRAGRGGPQDRARTGSDSPRPNTKPPLEIFATTLWEYPSQHYLSSRGIPEQGDRDYAGATPSWVIWQCLKRYTRENDLVIDPMCGSGTTIDVCADLGRRAMGFDLTPPPAREPEDIQQADARALPVADAVADFVFIDPPYSTHIEYSDDPRDIGKLDASGDDGGKAYYAAMEQVIREAHRVLKDRRYLALYVGDSWRKRKGGGREGAGVFMPIGFELFSILRKHFKPIDIIAVVRHNAKLQKGNWNKAAREQNYFLRGFNYLLIMKKEHGA